MSDTSLRRAKRLARALDASELHQMHDVLIIYNGMVVTLTAAFMSLTQDKIIRSFHARAFLEQLSSVPLPPVSGFFTSVGAFLLLALLGWLYREGKMMPTMRYACLTAEIFVCIVLLRSLDLAYDGIVLLVVADLLHRYSGRHQLVVLTCAMLGLYAIVDYNAMSFEHQVTPFDVYTSYYAPSARSWIHLMHTGLASFNLILFVFYLTLLIRQNHQEKQRIASLNAQLEEANTRLRAYAIEAESIAETRERNRLAREIHDTLGHALTGIAAGLDATALLVDLAPDKAKEQLVKIKETALRQEAAARRPRAPAAAAGHREHGGGIRELDRHEDRLRGPRVARAPAPRPGRGALPRRAGRHDERKAPRPRQAPRDHHWRQARRHLPAELEKGFGLRHMQERLALLHGKLRYWSDSGFTLEAILPENEEASNFL